MNLISLAYASLRQRRITCLLLVLLMSLGVATIAIMLHFGERVSQRLSADAQGIDLVVGAKGSPLQLILSSVYHLDVPTGNIPEKSIRDLRRMPQVRQVVPLALGDNFRGFRIVGTEPALLELYRAKLASGRLWQQPMEAVIGAEVARAANLSLGSTFAGSHGLSEGGDVHGDQLYKVVGIAAPTGGVADRLVLTPLESVWQVHGDHHHDEHKHKHDHHHEDKGIKPSDEVTALLVTYRSKAAALQLPRQINRDSALQAASPAFETARLLSLIGVGVDTLKFFGVLLVAISLIGMLVALLQSVMQRRYEMALMRALGARRRTLAALVLIETALLLLAALALGFALSRLAMLWMPQLSPQLAAMGAWPLAPMASELLVAGGLGVAGLVIALMPAMLLYRSDVSRLLASASSR
jgi:putative ABC transport system permease protein